jgi:hypothetical protein
MAVCTLFTSLVFVIAACGPRITNDNLDIVEKERTGREEIGKGISPKEVESILGQPTRSETTKLALETQKKEVEVVRYYYEQDGDQLALHFVDGKLISPVPKLGAPKQLPPQK